MPLKRKPGSIPNESLSLPLEIDDGRWSNIFGYLLGVLSLLCVVLFSLTAFAPIREVVTARGQIIPADDLIEVQHLEGGIVGNIEIKEGDVVSKGDLLISETLKLLGPN